MKKEIGDASLQDRINAIPDLVDYFRNDTVAPHAKHRMHATPVPAEETNWRDEQRAWRETAVLFNQSFHMPELWVRGRDAASLLSYIGINSFDNFAPGRAKSFIGCAPSGHVIGECILHRHGPDEFELISGQFLINWVQYVAESGPFRVDLERDNAIADNPTGRRVNFRFGLDGPNAAAMFDEAVDGQTPEIPFFRTARVRIAGKDVLCLRHGMAGHAGVEMSGAFDDLQVVRTRLIEVGTRYGLKLGGTRAYFSTLGEEGWFPYPLPAIYTGNDMRPFREWLSAESWEAKVQIGGSFVSNNIEDFYVTPWDLNLARLMKFDHDFVGREALEKMSPQPHRKKVTLVWNTDDVQRVFASLYEPGLPCKFMDMPTAQYAFQQADEVRTRDGRRVGVSSFVGYTVNERAWLSLALVNEADAQIGDEVVVVWGEPDGGTRKPHVERHRQIDIRATIAACPYAAAVQQMLRAPIGGHTSKSRT